MTMMRALALVFMLASCADRDRNVFVDEGSVCLFSGSEPRPGQDSHAYVAGAPLSVHAVSPGCFQTTCFEVESAECSITVSGDTLTIESSFVIDTFDRLQCKSDCGEVETTCATTESLEAGSYQVVHGDRTSELVVPSEGAPVCLTSS